jgi:hypothetical protein
MFLFPESSMIADETNGPTKEDVLPMMEKMAKKRNCRQRDDLPYTFHRRTSLPRGTTSEIIACCGVNRVHNA